MCASRAKSVSILYLLRATVKASGEPAHGHMTSDLKPMFWNTFRNASQEDMDPGKRKTERITVYT